jgi:hypothetical protein
VTATASTRPSTSLRRFLDCGILANGFVRVYCDACKQESLVAFSCKRRGFCPSCSARRASETAAHLVDSVLPQLPLRQFVLVMPFEWHRRLARDAELESKLLGLFVDELREHLREVTGVVDGLPGMVTFLQRSDQHSGSTLNLHVHFHWLALDGVFEPAPSNSEALNFVRAPVPTVAELDVLLQQIAVRARRLVASAGPEPEPHEPASPALVAQFDGFNLHADTSFEAHERVSVKRSCRYTLRTPLAQGRLTETASGSLLYRLKAPKPDGTSLLLHLVLKGGTRTQHRGENVIDTFFEPKGFGTPVVLEEVDLDQTVAAASNDRPAHRPRPAMSPTPDTLLM